MRVLYFPLKLFRVGASLSGLGEVVLTDGPDTYKDDTGKISGRSFIQDSFFYQNYSYIIRVNKSLQQFADAVRRLVHPSGTLMFAEYINEVSMSGDAGVTSDSFTRHLPIIGHYLPHTHSGPPLTQEDLHSQQVQVQLSLIFIPLDIMDKTEARPKTFSN